MLLAYHLLMPALLLLPISAYILPSAQPPTTANILLDQPPTNLTLSPLASSNLTAFSPPTTWPIPNYPGCTTTFMTDPSRPVNRYNLVTATYHLQRRLAIRIRSHGPDSSLADPIMIEHSDNDGEPACWLYVSAEAGRVRAGLMLELVFLLKDMEKDKNCALHRDLMVGGEKVGGKGTGLGVNRERKFFYIDRLA